MEVKVLVVKGLKMEQKYKKIDSRIFKALAEEQKPKILNSLIGGFICVGIGFIILNEMMRKL